MTIEQVLPRRLARLVTAEPDWDLVYAEELPRVFNFFRYRLGDCADTEDLTARTFEKAWQARHRYRSDVAGFATWLLTIARNIAIDHQRAAPALQAARCRGRRACPGRPTGAARGPAVRGGTARRAGRDVVAASARVDRDEVWRRHDQPCHRARDRIEREQCGNDSAPRGRIAARALVRNGNMSNEAWLHALRSDPSPLFKEQLHARLRGNEPGLSEGPRTGDETPARPLRQVTSIASAGRRSESR